MPYLARQRDFTLQAAEKRNRSQYEKVVGGGGEVCLLTQVSAVTDDEERVAEKRQRLR